MAVVAAAVGLNVFFYPSTPNAQRHSTGAGTYLPGIVCAVNANGTVNIAAWNAQGEPLALRNIPYLQAASTVGSEYCVPATGAGIT